MATPEMADPNFSHTVIFLLAVREEGALGVVLNRPSITRVDDLMPNWAGSVVAPAVMFFGGPVGVESVIGLSDSGTVDLTEEPPFGEQPTPTLRLFAGSAGWGDGQLETEIDLGSWWVFDGQSDDVLSTDPSNLWANVLRRQGGTTAWFALATANPGFN